MRHLTLLGVWAGVIGCAHIHPLDRNAVDFPSSLVQVNSEVYKRTVTLVLQDGRPLVVRSLRLSADSTSWRDARNGEAVVMPTDQIARLSFISRSTGAWDGLKTGFQVGAVLSLFIFGIPIFDPEETLDERLDRIGQTIAGGIVFAPPGLVVGLIRGSRITYRFDTPAASVSEELDDSP